MLDVKHINGVFQLQGKSIIPNPISNEIEKAMALIGKSLKSKTPANVSTVLVALCYVQFVLYVG